VASATTTAVQSNLSTRQLIFNYYPCKFKYQKLQTVY
jgi:hypothetical protein